MIEEFLTQLYRNFLGREPDAPGLSYWDLLLENGSHTAASVTREFLNSVEHQIAYKPIVQLYLAALNRVPDEEGLDYWVKEYQSGASLIDIANALVESDEFKNLHDQRTDEQFVKDLYRSALSREPDGSGEMFWNSMLDFGIPRSVVMLSFATSPEMTRNRSAEVDYILLHRGVFGEMPTREMIDAVLPVSNWEALIEKLYEGQDYGGADVPGLDRYEPPDPGPVDPPEPEPEPDPGPPPDTTAPTLSSSSPADGATNVSAVSDVILTFSETVVAGVGNIVLSNGSDTRAIATNDPQVTIAGNVVTINPTSDLLIGTTYNVQIDAGAFRDSAGNAYAGISSSTELDFTIDSTAPTILAFTVSSPTTLSVTSSEAGTAGLYDGSTLVGSAVTLAAANTAYGMTVSAQSSPKNTSLKVADNSGNVTISSTKVLLGTNDDDSELLGPNTTTTDYIFGFDGNDWLEGKQGHDVLSGGTGNDVFYTLTILGYTSDSPYASFDTITDLDVGDNLRIVLYETPVFDANSSTYVTSMTSPRNFVVVKPQSQDINANDSIFVDVGSYSPSTAITNGIVTFHLHGMSTTTSADRLTGGAGGDVIYGYGGDDSLAGSGGNDHIDGGSGNDSISGEAGDNSLTGGLGADQFVFTSLRSKDTISDFTVSESDVLAFDRSGLGLGWQYSDGAATILTVAQVNLLGAGAARNVIIQDTAANIAAFTNSGGQFANTSLALETDTGKLLFDLNSNYSSGIVEFGNVTASQAALALAANFTFIA